jgi:hypothetical protein
MLRKTPLFFECFPYVCPEPVLVKPPPYVCPEPVLVKDLFLNVKMAQKVAFFAPPIVSCPENTPPGWPWQKCILSTVALASSAAL